MSIASTITAPSAPLSTFPPPRYSSHLTLHPQNTRIHLSNLDGLLNKPPPSHPIPQLHQVSTAKSQNNNANANASNSRSASLFHALNLNAIIPSLRNTATEAMSPRSLTQLQRLLDSPRPSPKNPISATWRELHGSHNWDNLLDPLDQNLRRELVRYGDLVQAAYHAFHSSPATSANQQKRHVILPDRSYRVTKSLYATSSVELPKWIDGVAPWMTQRSSWIGYVAVCEDPQEIQRMGRRDIVLSLRGTSTCLEWAENFRAGLVQMSPDDDSTAKVAAGFYSLYKTHGEHVQSLSSTVIAEVKRLTELYKGEELSITVTGHSLGAALALFAADQISTCLPHVPPVAVFSFGGPRVGNRAFAEKLGKNGVKVLRVVNAGDVITRVPGVMEGTLDGYVHVGRELRVDSRASPYLRPDADPGCAHDLESYLHLVDGFMGSDCPFRSDAKRSLVRLLDQQRSNVKRLYVSEAKALGLDRFQPSHVSGCLASPSS